MSGKKNYSPLRYPGGKSCLSNFITDLTYLNGLEGGTYVELYAGGAGAALDLLFNDTFSQIHINDFDYHIYSFWYSILNHSEEFIKMLERVEISIQEWYHQQTVFKSGSKAELIDLGFSTFFLNRTNRSGIIFKAGPIGGVSQTGNYKIDVRFNKKDLIKRIERIADAKEKITLTNLDAVEILQNLNRFHPEVDNLFLYLDPPYYKKGKLLYLNNYDHNNHRSLANTMSNLNDVNWLISYDNVPQIVEMFRSHRMSTFDLNYTLQSKKFGEELLIFSDNLKIGDRITVNSRTNELVLI